MVLLLAQNEWLTHDAAEGGSLRSGRMAYAFGVDL